MQKNIPPRWQITEIVYSALTLALLLWFTYGIFIRAPYIGFYFNPTDGRILEIFIPSASSLQLGDKLIQVGDISWDQYDQDSRQGLLNDVKDGENIDIKVSRNNVPITVQWKIPGFNQAEFYARFFNLWWLAYIFWFLGFTAQVFVRPKDTRWKLLVASNYLTGLWVILGVLSARHLWESSVLLHATTWMLLPVYLHFHWMFPKPLWSVPKVIFILYMAGLLFFLGELVQLFPRNLYAFGLLLTLAGIVIIQGIHFIKRREERRQVGLVALATLLSILPSVVLSVSGAAGLIPQIAPLGLFTLSFMPLTYLFIIYRNQLGGLEIRVNRFFSLYAFLILLSTILIILVTPAVSSQIPGKISVLLALGTAMLTAVVSILAFPAFQTFVEQKFLGIKLPYQNLQEAYSSRITTSTSLPSLLQLLEEEVFPSLLIRQFAFIHVSNGSMKPLLFKNVSVEALPVEDRSNDLVARSGKYIPIFSSVDEWIRLILPLKVGGEILGFWLLGRRDPDDLYSQTEISILQMLANQTAIALSNIFHAEQLRKMYQNDIERNELERKQLALGLHDSVLNELAILRTSLDETSLTPQFKSSYEQVIYRLREIVSDLRPPMLMYGLKPAIREFADNLMERSGDKIRVKADLEASEERFPEQMELHLYRIVQEACENSLRYADPKTISIYGTLTSEKVDLNIHDDGKGFETDSKLALNTLLENRHFGLAGMIERAFLIGAKINIHSNPNAGTRIHLTWENNSDAL